MRGILTEPVYHFQGVQPAPAVIFCWLHDLFTRAWVVVSVTFTLVVGGEGVKMTTLPN